MLTSPLTLTDELQDNLEINWDENNRAALMDQNKHQAVAETGAERKKKEQFKESCEKLICSRNKE